MKQPLSSFTLSAEVPAPGARSSQINQVFNAALGVFLGERDGARYEHLYARYMGIAPLFRPDGRASEPWVPTDAMDAPLQTMLHDGVLRFGYVAGAPYVYRREGDLVGFDRELGSALVEIISEHYHHGDPGKLRAEWVEVTLASEEQADKMKVLYQGLVDGDFDLALSGQMVLPDDYIPEGVHPEWTAPTALLFTAISYTGRDRDKLDRKKLEALRSTTLEDFTKYAAAESVRLSLELRNFSVNNPGPSPPAAQNLVIELHRRGARAVWDTGDIASSDEVMLEATDHFAVGDSLASGAQSLLQGFNGTYLNIPANTEIWPIAGFTAAKKPT